MFSPYNPMGGFDPIISESFGEGQQAGFGQMNQAQNLQHQMAPMREMRMMEMMNRPQSNGRATPRPLTHAPLSGDYGGADLSGFTYDPMLRQQAENYGVHPLDPSQVHPNAFLNSPFFNRHPGLSSRLEGGIMGAAMTHGGATIGDNISSVAQSIMGVPGARHAMWEQQFAQPFQAQQTLETLHGQQQQNDLRQAQIDNYKDMADHRGDQDEIARLRADNTHQQFQDKLDATRPYSPDGGRSVFTYDSDAGKWNQSKNTDYVPKYADKMPSGMMPYYKAKGVDPETATPAQHQSILNAYQKDQERLAGSKAYASANGRIQAGLDQDTTATNTDKANAKADTDFKRDTNRYNNRMGSFIDKQPPSFWRRNKIDPRDPTAKQKWYQSQPGNEAPTRDTLDQSGDTVNGSLSPSRQGDTSNFFMHQQSAPSVMGGMAGSMVNSIGSQQATPRVRKYNMSTGQLE